MESQKISRQKKKNTIPSIMDKNEYHNKKETVEALLRVAYALKSEVYLNEAAQITDNRADTTNRVFKQLGAETFGKHEKDFEPLADIVIARDYQNKRGTNAEKYSESLFRARMDGMNPTDREKFGQMISGFANGEIGNCGDAKLLDTLIDTALVRRAEIDLEAREKGSYLERNKNGVKSGIARHLEFATDNVNDLAFNVAESVANRFTYIFNDGTTQSPAVENKTPEQIRELTNEKISNYLGRMSPDALNRFRGLTNMLSKQADMAIAKNAPEIGQ